MASGLGAGLLALAKGRQGYNQGKDQQSQRESQVKRQQDQERMLVLKMALEERERRQAENHRQAVLGETSRHNLAVETAGMNKPKLPDRGTPEYNAMIAAETTARRRAIVSNPMPSRARMGGGSRSSSVEETTLPDGTVVQGKPPKTTEGEKKAAALYGVALNDSEAINAMESNLPGKMISKVPILGNIVTGQQLPEYQAQRAAANRFVDQWLRFTSGAQVTPSERENAIKTFIPEPGDTRETIAQKRKAREQVMEGLRKAAGNAGPSQSPTAIARGDQYSDADYYEMLRGEGGTHEQAVAKVEARRAKRRK